MAETKTKATAVPVATFLAGVAHEGRRADCQRLVTIMGEITGEPATMWGPSMVGFGRYHYVYDSGHSGDAMVMGFAPRASEIVLYMGESLDAQPDLVARLGKHRRGKGCLYIKRLDDHDETVLRTLIRHTVDAVRARWPDGGQTKNCL